MLAMYVHVVGLRRLVAPRSPVAVVIVPNHLNTVAVSTETAILSARFNLDYLGLWGRSRTKIMLGINVHVVIWRHVAVPHPHIWTKAATRNSLLTG